MTWYVDPRHTLTLRDPAQWVVHDPVTGTSWFLTPATRALWVAVRDGWQPGQPMPSDLAAACHAAGAGDGPDASERPDPGSLTTDLVEVLATLAHEGLFRDQPGSDPEPPAARIVHHGWHDVRLPLAICPPPPPGLRPILLWVGVWGPALLGACAGGLVWTAHRRGVLSAATAQWAAFRDDHGLPVAVLLSAAIVWGLTLLHELGHALLMGAAGGAPVPIGLRLFFGLPNGYADCARLATVRQRQHRVAILLGGILVELALLILAALWALQWPATVPLPLVVVLGYTGVSVLISLVPFYQRDGYFILQELTGLQHLRTKADAAFRSLVAAAPAAPSSSARDARAPVAFADRWLPWYGLFHHHGLSLLGAATALTLGWAAGFPRVGAALGGLVGVGYLGWAYTTPRFRHPPAPRTLS